MLHLVRVVFTNGASVTLPMPWQRPYKGLEVTTKFLETDFLSGADAKKSKRVVGQRARFENKFGEE